MQIAYIDLRFPEVSLKFSSSNIKEVTVSAPLMAGAAKNGKNHKNTIADYLGLI